MPDARLQFERQTFEHLLQRDFNAFAATIVMSGPLGNSVLVAAELMGWRSAAVLSRRGRSGGWSSSGRSIIHFRGRFVIFSRCFDRPPQNVLQKAKHVNPNRMLMDTRRSLCSRTRPKPAFSVF